MYVGRLRESDINFGEKRRNAMTGIFSNSQSEGLLHDIFRHHMKTADGDTTIN